MPEPQVVRTGQGPRLVLVHGSATDHTAWSIQLASGLRERFTLIAYDRRALASVAEQAADLAAVIGEEPALVVGSSFGAVIALELARTQRQRFTGLVLVEPPMAATDDPPDLVAAAAAVGGDPSARLGPGVFLAQFDRIARESGGPAAAEYFLRTVLGEPAFARIPRAFVERSIAHWAEIRADCAALLQYRPGYAALATLELPVLLIGGELSAPYFALTLDALERVLPDTRRAQVARAGHMLHAEAPAEFAALLCEFADSLPR